MTRGAAVAIVLALGAVSHVAAAQRLPERAFQVRDRFEIPESFQRRVVAAATGELVAYYAVHFATRPDGLQDLTPVILAGVGGAIIGASIQRLESECSITHRLGWSALGASAGLALTLALYQAEDIQLQRLGLYAGAFAVPIGAAAGAERKCPRS